MKNKHLRQPFKSLAGVLPRYIEAEHIIGIAADMSKTLTEML